MSLLERVEAIKAMQDLDQYDEASAKQVLVLSLLNELGWDTFNREEVYPEFPLDETRLDYCLQLGGVLKVFIEAKKPSVNLEKYEEQILRYAFKHTVKLAILTNGVVWWFYLPMKEGEWQERNFFAIDIRNQETIEVSNNFLSFLAKEHIASGKAIEQAEKLLESKSRVRKIQDTIPKAWRELITTSDDLLLEIVADKVESLCGYKPEEQMVLSFLRKVQELPRIEPTTITKPPPIISEPIGSVERSGPSLVMDYKNAQAEALYNEGRVIVLSGSTIMVEIHKSLNDKGRNLRQDHHRKGTIKEYDEKGLLKLTNDIKFNSPSGAAQFVAGCSVSGNRDWRIKDTGTLLGVWLKSIGRGSGQVRL